MPTQNLSRLAYILITLFWIADLGPIKIFGLSFSTGKI